MIVFKIKDQYNSVISQNHEVTVTESESLSIEQSFLENSVKINYHWWIGGGCPWK